MNNKKLKIIIRQETSQDHSIVESLIAEAFKHESLSDQSEHKLVSRLRESEAFIPELSLVAVFEDEILGFILLTKLQIVDGSNYYPSLCLAPVAVKPKHQGKGIGGKLIKRAHDIAILLGHQSVVVLGHEKYYPRFGYLIASFYNIKCPFNGVPNDNFMVIELVEDALKNVRGMVKYPKTFYQ